MFRPAHVSEKFAGLSRFDDCGPCSAIMLANSEAKANVHPGTLAETDAFREDAGAGDTGAMFANQVKTGLKVRYSVSTGLVQGVSAVWAALTPGVAACVFGHLSNFPFGHRLRRGGPTYTGGHIVYVQREDATENVWWIDPLISKSSTYTGEYVTKNELAIFTRLANADTAIFATVGVDDEVTLTAVKAQRWTANGINGVLRANPRRTDPILARIPAGNEVISYGEYYDAATDNSWRAVEYPSGSAGVAWLLRFGPGVAKDHDFVAGAILAVPGLSQADLDAAVAADRAKARITYS